ncbi:MAG: hypothetical protein JXR37_36495 [Kiritimatiellae bacterium]|nr:hypothetical protein [Kiritimatiellia bacterium]
MILSTERLEPGQILRTDVIVRGTVLAKAGARLTKSMIARLQKWDVPRVDVEGEEEEPEPAPKPQAVPLAENPDYLHERRELETLFATTADDAQMALLKSCFLHVLKEKYGG